MIDNNGNSTYDSFQAHVSKRLSHGLTGQFAYTFSKTLGDTTSSNTYRDVRNFALSKSLLSIDRPQLFQWNVSWAVPFGHGQDFLKNTPRWLDAVVGGWNVSSSFVWQSGVPLTFTSGAAGAYVTTFSNLAVNTANLVGALPANMSQVVKGNGFVSYFQGLTSQPIPASQLGSLGVDSSLAGRFTNQQVVNAQGQAVLVDPQSRNDRQHGVLHPGGARTFADGIECLGEQGVYDSRRLDSHAARRCRQPHEYAAVGL